MIELSRKRSSFSQKLKEELLEQPVTPDERLLLLAFALMSTAKINQQSIRYSLAYRPFVEFLRDTIARQFAAEAELIIGKGISTFELSEEAAVNDLRTWLAESFHFDFVRGRIGLDPAAFDEAQRRIILRALFLSCGSLAEPSKTYHLEFSIRRISLVDFAVLLLKEFALRCGIIKRYGSNVIYIKDADDIAAVLGLSGAAKALLHFEAGRVDKEVNNSVNRVVNCDSANARRIADTAARQMDLLERLQQEKGFEFLPPQLRETAESRLANPGLSIAELGALQSKSIGKSGMHHRLRKLEQIAEEELCL